MTETVLITPDEEPNVYPDLARTLFERGVEVIVFDRRPNPAPTPYALVTELKDLEKIPYLKAVINLAGAPLRRRFSAAHKQIVYDSRIQNTLDLIGRLRKFDRLPEVFINASSIYYYLGQKVKCYEDTPVPEAETFLSEVFTAWEDSAKSLMADGVRLCFARAGEILSGKGGILRKNSACFENGLGMAYGNGNQVISWIHAEDYIAAILRLLREKELSGAFNFVAPSPCSNNEFAQALAARFGKKPLGNLPDWAVWLFYGQMGYETMLSGVSAVPQKLLRGGFFFKYPTIQEALASLYD